MSNQDYDHNRIKPPALTTEVPLRFGMHSFAAYCYNTIGCHVMYNQRYQAKDTPGKVAPQPPFPDYKERTWGSVEIGIGNFPPPAEVHWKSLDGVAHEATVDIGAIFKDELTWHNVPKAEMTDFFKGPVAGEPNIYLEVNDRTINVYITMFIPTRAEQIPGNKESDFRRDIFLAWTQTY